MRARCRHCLLYTSAVEILEGKIAAGARIRIVGDYDIDGVGATYILYLSLIHI